MPILFLFSPPLSWRWYNATYQVHLDIPVVSYHSTYHSLGCWLRPYAVSHFLPLQSLFSSPSFFSPRSMEGGDLRWFWSGFEMFERIDQVTIYHHFLAPSNLLQSRYIASKHITTRQVLRLPLVSLIVRPNICAHLISLFQLSRTLSRHH